MKTAQTLFARRALLPAGWATDVRVTIDGEGLIEAVEQGAIARSGDLKLGTRVLLPAAANLHSHTFQRAMAGMSETRGDDPTDSFWTWRKVMYRFLEELTPEQIEAIAALAFMEMAEAGYAAVAEFHYLHHQRGGTPYANPGELSDRMLSAADATGLGLTLLPVLYQHAGCDRQPLQGGQLRFGHSSEAYAALIAHCEKAVAGSEHRDTRLGIAPHSLRAVGADGLDMAVKLAAGRPTHMHIAEQTAEIDEVLAAWGARPMDWLFDHQDVGGNWCLIHSTHLTEVEVGKLARSGATAGLCPITESSLGDGIFEGRNYVAAGGSIGVGTDSNIEIDYFGELRTLEYSQRLRDRQRAVFATPERSTGRRLFDMTLAGGARALGRPTGAIAEGRCADLMSVETDSHWFDGADGDELLDRLIFTGARQAGLCDVWSAGRHIVRDGSHCDRERIVQTYRKAVRQLQAAV